MHSSAENVDITNIRITHKTAQVPLLEAVSFKDKPQALTQIRSLVNVAECVLIQTCNRVELFLVSADGEETAKTAQEYLASNAGAKVEEARQAICCDVNQQALNHLLRVVSGLESMVIGEDQVIKQVWDAYLEAEEAGTAGPVLNHLFNRAVNFGRRVRAETGINKGAVSIGSAAVELAECMMQSFHEKQILVMGAGEMGTLVAKALARRCLNPVFIANRTYHRAVRLAEMLQGKVVRFTQLGDVLVDADVVICSTSAPHYLLTKELLSKLIRNRKNPGDLLVIDISNPRNVEKTIADLEHVKLCNIDDLQLITEKNKQERQKAMEKATRIIDEELVMLDREIRTESVRKVIAELLAHTEGIRQRELEKALNMLGGVDERQKKVIGDLTNILLKQTFVPVIENLREAAKDGNSELICMAVKLFDDKKEAN